MAKIDPEQERQQLADHYSRQVDGRLEKVAREGYELSDLAKEVLRAELKKRGLQVELAQFVPARIKKAPEPADRPEADAPEADAGAGQELPQLDSEAEDEELVTIRRFRDLPEALLAKGSLDSAGIECGLADDNMVRMDWFYSNAIGGIKLLVKAEEAASAEQILSQPIPENFDVSGVGEYEQPRCPKCGSLDINFRELDPATYFSLGVTYLGVGVPIPIHRQAWRCHSCDVEWEEDDMAEPGQPSG